MSETRRPGAVGGNEAQEEIDGRAQDEDADEVLDGAIDDALDGNLDEEGQAPDEEDAGPQDLAPRREPTRQSQRERRRRAERQLAEERRRAEALEQRLSALERGRAQIDPVEHQRRERDELERVAQMPLEQQSRYWYDKGRQEFGGALATLQQQISDNADRGAFERAAERSALARQLEPEVERMVAQERARGNFGVTRMATYYYLLGQRADRGMGNQETGRTAQRRPVRRRPAATQSAEPRPASRASGDRDAYLRRLENYRF